jgi:hypothetical protein
LSYPDQLSVNDGIPQDMCTVQYQTIDDAVSLLKFHGKGSLMSKTDLENSYRLVPISLKKNSLNISGFSLADFKFLLYLYSRLPTYGILKPNLKPVRRKYFPFHYIRVTSVQISPPL